MDSMDVMDDFVGEGDIDGIDVFLKMLHLRGTDNSGVDKPA